MTTTKKVLAAALAAAFLCSCAKAPLALSPDEVQKLGPSRKVVVETKDGKKTALRAPQVDGRTLTGNAGRRGQVEIEFSSIKSVKVTGSRLVPIALVYAGSAVGLALLIHGINTAPSPPGCCPYIYSFDGRDFHFEAEPFGAAVCEGMKRSEWSVAEYLAPTQGAYRLLVANELEETEYVDEIRLLVADHPAGLAVVPDASGGLHTIASPLPPRTARDSRGNDLAARLAARDDILWADEPESAGPDSPGALREELTLEFPKPAGARQAKLLVNATMSSWAAHVGKRFLELHGEELPAWYAEVDRHGPAFFETMAWHLSEEMYLLQVRVLTPDGWRTRGTVLGGGPLSSKDKAYVLDVADIPGDTLTIRLTPPVGFWTIDQLAVDYSDDVPVSVAELKPRATDRAGRDVSASLRATDGAYLVLPQAGDSAELTFLAPPRAPGTRRTVILKASGFYRHHIETAGVRPQADLLRAFHADPGATLRFARVEYLDWKAKVDAGVRARGSRRD